MTSSRKQLLPLSPGQVDIWLTPVSSLDQDLNAAYRRLLSAPERERLPKFLVPGPRLVYLVSRALLRTTLSRYADVAEDEWRFETNAFGWPHIVYPAHLHQIQFNLSHTGGLAACAIARDCEIGIDVENTRRDLDFASLAKTAFSAVEIARMTETAPGDQRTFFFSSWTLKEAYVKARRMGLSLALDGFWFDLDHPIPHVHFTERCPDDSDRWQFRQYTPTDDHCLALAVSFPGIDPRIGLHWTGSLKGGSGR